MTAQESDPQFEALLEHIREARGFDFTVYKRSTLMRRTGRRMQDLSIQSYGDYLDHIQVHPDEFDHLFNVILINVSSFFRDPPAWEYLAQEIVPTILKVKSGEEPIRLWSAGVAAGEEAYSLTMLMAEAMGADDFKSRVKIYATDLDEDALAQARQGRYPAKDIQSVPEDLRTRYFTADADGDGDGDGYVFRTDLRRSLIFGRHDLVRDAPISHLDLVACRNTLMYFNAEAQAKILSRLHFALNDEGFLFLGKAEMLFRHDETFTPVELKHRVFAKIPRAHHAERPPAAPAESQEGEDPTGVERLGLRALNAAPFAHLVVDADGRLALANTQATSLFGLRAADAGRPLEDLDVSRRPVELHLPIRQAHADRHSVRLTGAQRAGPEGHIQLFDVQVSPLMDEAGAVVGTGITFEDVTVPHELRAELDRSNNELTTTNEELQSTNEALETTNEELQSSNEALETTNEELQSSNEELETMNEELQSTNEQLRTLNDELNERTRELNRLNLYMGSIFTNLKSGVVVVDADLRVHVWNARAEQLWGVDGEDVVGELLTKLDIGLPVTLLEPLRACLEGGADHQQVTVVAVNRRSKPIRCQVTCTVLLGDNDDRQGVIMLMDEVQ